MIVLCGDHPMTQMLLFDSPGTKSTVVPVTQAAGQVTQTTESGEPVGQANVAAQLDHGSGLHHMGDLARLVLLRYELVAKRRALMAARKAAK